MLTNQVMRFQKIKSLESDVSHRHTLIDLFLKISFSKLMPQDLRYRNHDKFDEKCF